MTSPSQLERPSEPCRRNVVERAIPWLLALVVFGINLVCLPREASSGDPIAFREEARSLIELGTLAVPSTLAIQVGDPGQYFFRNTRTGEYYSKYGVMNGLLNLPPLLAERAIDGSLPPFTSPRRIVYLNAYNVLLSVILAVVLYRAARLYTDRAWVAALWALCCLYGTFLWYYQRVQLGELYQTILFTLLFDQLVRSLRASREGKGGWSSLVLAWLATGALCLTKVVYVALVPAVAACVLFAGRHSHRRRVASVLLPASLIVLLVGWVAYVKFGSPFLTGYEQWWPEVHQPRANLWPGVSGFLFSVQWGVFANFPVLALSLVGYPLWFRRHRREALFAVTVFAAFLLMIASLPSWRGEWGYGPRYLLLFLPVASLPFVYVIGWIAGVRAAGDGAPKLSRRATRSVVGLVCTAIIVFSAYLQTRMSAMGFYVYYHVRGGVELRSSVGVPGYFYDRPFGMICADLLRYREDPTREPPFLVELREKLPKDAADRIAARTRELIRTGNYYWFATDDPKQR